MKTVQPILYLCIFTLITNIAKCHSQDRLIAMMAVVARKSNLNDGQWRPELEEKLDAFVLKEGQLTKWKELLLKAKTDGVGLTEALKKADLDTEEEEALDNLYVELRGLIVQDWREGMKDALLNAQHDQIMVMTVMYLRQNGYDLTDVKLTPEQKKYLDVLEMFFKKEGRLEKMNMVMEMLLSPRRLRRSTLISGIPIESYLHNLVNDIPPSENWILNHANPEAEQKKALLGIIRKIHTVLETDKFHGNRKDDDEDDVQESTTVSTTTTPYRINYPNGSYIEYPNYPDRTVFRESRPLPPVWQAMLSERAARRERRIERQRIERERRLRCGADPATGPAPCPPGVVRSRFLNSQGRRIPSREHGNTERRHRGDHEEDVQTDDEHPGEEQEEHDFPHSDLKRR